MGMVGLILLFFVILAITAPLLVSQQDIGVFDPPGQPLQPPSLEFPLGTDDFGGVGPRPGDEGLGSRCWWGSRLR